MKESVRKIVRDGCEMLTIVGLTCVALFALTLICGQGGNGMLEKLPYGIFTAMVGFVGTMVV